jgi:CRP-like cAMP-binding protein
MEVNPGTHGSAGGAPSRQSFLEGGEPISFARGDVIARRATLCDRLLILDTGYVLLREPENRLDSGGYLLGPGDPLGEECFQPGAAWKTTVAAVTPVTAYAFQGTRIARVCRQFPGLAAYVLSRLHRRKRASASQVSQLDGDCEQSRLTVFIQLVAEHFGRPTESPSRKYLPVPEEQLGALLGVGEETVRTTLASREQEGLVGRGERRMLWVNVLSSCALALILGARTISGPGLPVMVDGETILMPVRGRRGRAMKLPERNRLALLSAGPCPWTVGAIGPL